MLLVTDSCEKPTHPGGIGRANNHFGWHMVANWSRKQSFWVALGTRFTRHRNSCLKHTQFLQARAIKPHAIFKSLAVRPHLFCRKVRSVKLEAISCRLEAIAIRNNEKKRNKGRSLVGWRQLLLVLPKGRGQSIHLSSAFLLLDPCCAVRWS